MKKISILLTTLSIVISLALNAQVDKKDILVGGNFGYNNGDQNGSSNSSNANITPRIGYAIGNNSVLSARLGFAFNNSKSDGNQYKFNSHTFSTGASWKKYFPFNEKLGWYTDLNGTYYFGKSKSTNTGTIPSTTETRSRGYLAGINPGIYFVPVTGMLISADVGGVAYSYGNTKYIDGTSVRNSGFSANFLNSFNFGIDFIINRKKK